MARRADERRPRTLREARACSTLAGALPMASRRTTCRGRSGNDAGLDAELLADVGDNRFGRRIDVDRDHVARLLERVELAVEQIFVHEMMFALCDSRRDKRA